MGSTGGHQVTSAGFGDVSTQRLHDILRLRCDVFVVEQACAYAELDGRDVEPGTGHHWIDVDGELACYARTLTEPDGSIRIGRVVTAPRHRGAGLAAIAVATIVERHLEQQVDQDVDQHVVLDAQSHLVDWYGRLGFEPDGAEFVEDGIPHVPMRLVSRA